MQGVPLKEWAQPHQIDQLEAIWSQAHLSAIVRALRGEGLDCFLVGGVVRDLLLGRCNKDVDLVVDGTADTLLTLKEQLASQTSSTPVVLDELRGTLRLCFSNGEEFDLVALQGATLLEDLSRRDLCLNAIAVNSDGGLYDPLDGLRDLQNGVLRMVYPETFQADPVRVLRCLRFAAQLDFTIEERTLTALRRGAGGLRKVAGERIIAELAKLFASANPKVIPELLGVGLEAEQFPPGVESQAILERTLSEGPLTLAQGLALLFGPTLESSKRKDLFERLRLSREDRRYLEAWWNGARFLQEQEEWSLASIFELSRVAGPAFVNLAQLLEYGEVSTRLSAEVREQIRLEALKQGRINWQPFPWSGSLVAELCQRSPGAWLGTTMRTLESAWACGELRDEQELKSYLRLGTV